MQKDAGQRREQIVEAAYDIVTKGGPGALTAQAVTKAVGVSRPLLYHYFDTMEALLGEVIERYAGRFRASVADWPSRFVQEDMSMADAVATVVSDLRSWLVDSCPLLPDTTSPASPAYLGYLARCAEILAEEVRDSDSPLAQAVHAGSEKTDETMSMLLFGMYGMLTAHPQTSNDEVASIVTRLLGVAEPAEAPRVETPQPVEAPKVGFLKRLFG